MSDRITACDLLSFKLCTGQCLLGLEHKCKCRCRGRWHAVLADAEIPETPGVLSMQPVRLPSVPLLDDLLSVLCPGERRIWSPVAAERLAAHKPELYGEWDAKRLSSELRPLGVLSLQLWDGATQRNGRGYRRDDLEAARKLAQRRSTRRRRSRSSLRGRR